MVGSTGRPWDSDVKKGYYSPKRRALMARGEQINHTEVFDYWGWVCNICGSDINKFAGRDDWMRVSLEHVVPLSRGGRHEWDNVRPAHLRCNQEKGNKLPGE